MCNGDDRKGCSRAGAVRRLFKRLATWRRKGATSDLPLVAAFHLTQNQFYVNGRPKRISNVACEDPACVGNLFWAFSKSDDC